MWKIFTFVLHKLCVSATVALTVFWLYKYTLNEDVSLLDYKKFYEAEEDVHPVLSLCFANPFLQDKLAQHGTNQSVFLDFLRGEYFSNEMLDIDYDTVTLDLRDFIQKVWVAWRNGITTSMTSVEDRRSAVSDSYNGFFINWFF